jgi:hypothetical protein
VPATFERDSLSGGRLRAKEAWDEPPPVSAWRQWIGISGVKSGRSGTPLRSFVYSLAFFAVVVSLVVASNVVTWMHDRPGSSLGIPIVAEGTSALTLLLFFWIPWLAWRWAPLFVRPRWKLLVHISSMPAFAFCHIGSFVLLRRLVAWMTGGPDTSGPFMTQFIYEVRKDALSYLIFVACFAFADRLRSQRAPVVAPDRRTTFDIRDGAKLTRVPIADILAVSSAGNYVEFVLADSRRLLMRLSLSALETELGPLGFLRTHRSWLVNVKRVTALKPAGSGDYEVELTTLTVPLSRRFSRALAQLRDAGA